MIFRSIFYPTTKTIAKLALCCLVLSVITSTVLLVRTTQAQQDIFVTAKVNAPLPTSPAIITSPYDQQHFTTTPITVTGTCGDGAYVIVYRNSAAAGIGACQAGNFTIQIDLVPGANELRAQVYNITDNPGPTSPSITVYYDILSAEPAPPLETSLNLRVTSVDGIPFSFGRSFTTSANPLIRGYAPAYSVVIISFAPGVDCKTTANASGRWTCSLSTALELGSYTVRVSSTSPQGVKSTFPAFTIIVAKVMTPSSPAEGLRLLLHFPYRYHIYKVYEPWNGDLVISGGAPPYTLSIDWKDGTTFKQDNINTTPVRLTHVFTRAGDYHPILRVIDQQGNAASLQIFIKVIETEEKRHVPQSPLMIILVGSIALLIVIAEVMAIRTIKKSRSK